MALSRAGPHVRTSISGALPPSELLKLYTFSSKNVVVSIGFVSMRPIPSAAPISSSSPLPLHSSPLPFLLVNQSPTSSRPFGDAAFASLFAGSSFFSLATLLAVASSTMARLSTCRIFSLTPHFSTHVMTSLISSSVSVSSSLSAPEYLRANV